MLHLLKMACAQASRQRAGTLVRRTQGFALAPNRGICLPGILAVAMIPVGSPAMSATYSVSGGVTGESSAINYQGGAPASFNDPPGDSVVGGASFSGTASNLDGGSASVSGGFFIGDFTQFSSPFGREGGGTAMVEYTIRIVGPATSALIPVHVNMVASVGGIQIMNLGPENPDEIPIDASAAANVVLSYANDLLNFPALPKVVAGAIYEYQFFSEPGFPAPRLSRRPIVLTE
jgi:hypothetical protein